MPRVSVIVPSYNQEQCLPGRLQGILEQSYEDFEILLLDDCSSDQSRRVLSEFARTCNKPVKTVYNEEHSRSPLSQWRKGAQLARGEYLWIAESDHDAEPDFLKEMMAAADHWPSAGLIYCQSTIIDQNGNDQEIRQSFTDDCEPERWRSNYFNNGRDECARYLCRGNLIPNASAALVRRTALLSTNREFDDMQLAGDWMKWAEILLSSDVVYLAAPLNRLRVKSPKTIAVSQMLDETSRVRGFIAAELGSDPEVVHRILEATLSDWRQHGSDIEGSDSFSWFLEYRRRLRHLGPSLTLPTWTAFLKNRLLHWH